MDGRHPSGGCSLPAEPIRLCRSAEPTGASRRTRRANQYLRERSRGMGTDLNDTGIRTLRDRIGHQLVDGDGHLVEVREAIVRFAHARGEESLLDDPAAKSLLVPGNEGQRFPSLSGRRHSFIHKANRWFTPANPRAYPAGTMP